jgi:hydrogenase maturation protein HypF
VLSSVEDRFDPARIACCFQNSLADLVVAHTARVAKSEGIDQAVLSGGSFQNPVLFQRVSDRLAQRGLRVYTHDEVPPSDGGVALGQAAVAAALLSGVPSAQKTDIKRSSWGDM